MQPHHTTKICPRCKTEKPLTEYYKCKSRRDGHDTYCKTCVAAYHHQLYTANKDRITERNLRWQKENTQRVNEKTRRWREANPEYFVEYRKAHAEKRSAYNRQYAATHREEREAYRREYQRANPERGAAKTRNYRARKRAAEGGHTAKQFQQLIAHYGDTCLCCGKRRKLTADHVIAINNGGSNDIGNIQPLCGPCNSGKGDWYNTDYRPDGGAFARSLIEEGQ